MVEDNVVQFTGQTTLDTPADTVLAAAAGQMRRVVVIGETNDGDNWYSANTSDLPALLWLIEWAKMQTLHMGHDDNGQ